MPSPSLLLHAGRAAALLFVLVPTVASATPTRVGVAPVEERPEVPPADVPPLPEGPSPPEGTLPPTRDPPPPEGPPATEAPLAVPVEAPEPQPDGDTPSSEPGPATSPDPPAPETGEKKKKKKEPPDPSTADPGSEPSDPAAAPKKKKKKKKKKPKEKHRVYQGTEYRLGVFPASYVQGPSFSVGASASLRQRLEPKKNHPVVLGLDYEFEPFSTKTLGFPEEDEANGGLRRTLVEPIHSVGALASRKISWGKLVTTTLDVTGDAWFPDNKQHQRMSMRMTPGLRIGRATGFFGDLNSEFYYKKFPNYFIDSVKRRIDQEGLTPTAQLGYNHRKLLRASLGFTIDFTHYLDARYNAIGADGTYIRANRSKNYIDYIPFADLMVRPVKGLRIRARYAFERQKTQHYDRVMSGRDEFASLTQKFFHGYYDYRRHRANLWVSWDFRNRLHLAGGVGAWIRHFDVYEARTVDNFWTGQLRLDAEIEGSLELTVRLHTIEGRMKRMKHDLFLSLLGSHVSRTSNQMREISLATNFDITRVFLGFEVRGR